jgi:hypothetical protein
LRRGEERKERATTDGEEMTQAMDEAATSADETTAATVDEVVTVATSTSTRTASSIDARKQRRQSSSSVMRGFGRGDAMVMGSVVEYRRSTGLRWRALGRRRWRARGWGRVRAASSMVVVLDLRVCERALLETFISHRVGPTCLSSPYTREKGQPTGVSLRLTSVDPAPASGYCRSQLGMGVRRI